MEDLSVRERARESFEAGQSPDELLAHARHRVGTTRAKAEKARRIAVEALLRHAVECVAHAELDDETRDSVFEAAALLALTDDATDDA